MLNAFQPSLPTSVPLWFTLLLAVIAASGTWLTLLLNRKRLSSVWAEDHKLSAEARSIEIQSITELLRDLRDARADLTAAVDSATKKAEENRETQEFLRGQVTYREELEIMARKAAHAAIGELQRAVWAIHLRDEAIKEARAAVECAETQLRDNSIEFAPAELGEVTEFVQMKHEDIVKYQRLPLPPQVS